MAGFDGVSPPWHRDHRPSWSGAMQIPSANADLRPAGRADHGGADASGREADDRQLRSDRAVVAHIVTAVSDHNATSAEIVALPGQPGAAGPTWRCRANLALPGQPGAAGPTWRCRANLALPGQPGAAGPTWRCRANLALPGQPGAAGPTWWCRASGAWWARAELALVITVPGWRHTVEPGHKFMINWVGRGGEGRVGLGG
ncbi:hypothetical protein Cs7R123_54530 [Catellatospora sp. TT07R-123]|nr:hypothetical protein Cs7R123_54530 [Catellatospora sp. TT07R-123]